MALMVKRHKKTDGFKRFQIYPQNDLAEWIDRKHVEHPARVSASTLICAMLDEYRRMMSKK